MGVKMEYGEELKELQKVLLDILKEVKRVCDENNIDYFIIGGTALGAVRHKGFIPWDDDIDIGMTRDNYEKFIKIANTKLSEEFFLQTMETEEETPFYFAKVRKNKTKFIEKYVKDINMNHGIFIDIFPYDKIPNDTKLRKRQQRKVNILANMFIAKSTCEINSEIKTVKDILKNCIRRLLHYILIPFPKKLIYNQLNKECKKYSEEECSKISFVKYGYLTIDIDSVNNLKYEEGSQISFEGVIVKCPRKITQYLNNQYGDFMKLPKKEDRKGHRPYILEL